MTRNNNIARLKAGDVCNEPPLNVRMSSNWRASLVPAAAVIPAPIAYTNVVAVKKLVVEPSTRGCGQGPRCTGGTACALRGRGRPVGVAPAAKGLGSTALATASAGLLACKGRPRFLPLRGTHPTRATVAVRAVTVSKSTRSKQALNG